MKTIKFTREGKRFFIAVFLIGFTSFSTGNNLIYLLFSLMLSISLISFISAFINLRGLSLEADFREPLYANMPFNLEITYKNRKPVPSYSVTLLFPFGISEQLYTPVIKRGRVRKIFHDVVIGSRGRLHLHDFRLSTGFPFIFMYISRSVVFKKDLLVYPELSDVSSFFRILQSNITDRETVKKGQDGEFIFSREYVYGEDSRKIDWKATAKTRKTMVREYSRHDENLATVIFDNSTGADNYYFEKSVSITASLCCEFIDRGFYLRLITCGKVVPFGNSRSHLFKVLDILAVIKKDETIKCYTGETLEGTSILVKCSDITGFSGIEELCSEVIDARNI